MLDLDNVTILSVNTVSPNMSVKALRYSSKEIRFKSKKILSHVVPTNLSDDIDFVCVPEFNGREHYSDFIMNNLGDYIDSEFVLMIHDDGFIINPHLWSDDFLSYDYIGAPWPGAPGQKDKRVGNGGFCIRSKRLVDFCKNIKADPGHDDWTIGVTQNDYLKECGFTFAPVEVAMKFSLELEISECAFDLNKTFGFHGKRHSTCYQKINLLNSIE